MADVSKVKVGSTSYNIKDTAGRKEANLEWGGKNFSASYGCIDAAMVPELGANRLAFISANSITIEYSRDNGDTWLDYEPTDADKVNLFNGNSSTFSIGKANANYKATEHAGCQLRVTIDSSLAPVYTAFNKFVIYVTTYGSYNCTCTIQKAKKSEPTNYVDHVSDVPIAGWSGYNVINCSSITTYGNTDAQYIKLRFIFKGDVNPSGTSNYSGLYIQKIFGFGGVGWITPSAMAKTGHMYTYDYAKNTTFPANLKIYSNKQVSYLTATPTSGQVVVTDGTSGGMKTTGYTIAKSVPSGAEFTDTQSDWNVTDTSSKAYIKNKPTTLGTVTTVKVGSTSYSPTSGVVSLPAYPSVPITAIQQDGTPLTPSSGTVNIQVGLNKNEYGPNASQRILARGNVFVPVFTTNPEATSVPNWGYNGLVCVKIGTPTDILTDIPSGVTWSNFAYFRMMNMSVLSATVSWTEAAHSTSLIIGYIYDNHISPSSNYAYSDYPMKAVTTLVQRDNGSGANRDTARIIISDTDGSIRVAPNGSTATAFANYHRVQFSISYINQQAYGPNDGRWYNEAP